MPRLPSAFHLPLALILLSSAHAAEWHVTVDGLDSAAGSASAPFASVHRAQVAASPGDTIWIHGGTYRPRPDSPAGTGDRRRSLYICGTLLDKSGRPDAPIRYLAAPGETPIFDFSDFTPPHRRVAAFSLRGSWIIIHGLEVTGVQVTIKQHTQSICFLIQGDHNHLENLRLHDSQAIGVYIQEGAHNLILNCDSWNNHDFTSEDGKGGNVDGFGAHIPKGDTGNAFRGCRAWFNSDDGFDLINASEPVLIENCWAFSNGLHKDGRRLADGNGFKAGGYASTPSDRLPRPIPRHIVRDCIAAGNKSSGFYANHHPGGIDFINNSASGNASNFNFLNRLADNSLDVPGYGHLILNNLSFAGRQVSNLNEAECQLFNNTFADAHPPTATDLVSTDFAQLTLPRQPDGSLPLIAFLRPATPIPPPASFSKIQSLNPAAKPWIGALQPARSPDSPPPPTAD